jgi:hypothetical protein
MKKLSFLIFLFVLPLVLSAQGSVFKVDHFDLTLHAADVSGNYIARQSLDFEGLGYAFASGGTYGASISFLHGSTQVTDYIITPSGTTPTISGNAISGCVYDINYDWNCTDWSSCSNRVQTRTCNNYNNCGTVYGRPEVVRSCLVEGEIVPARETPNETVPAARGVFGITGQIVNNLGTFVSRNAGILLSLVGVFFIIYFLRKGHLFKESKFVVWLNNSFGGFREFNFNRFFFSRGANPNSLFYFRKRIKYFLRKLFRKSREEQRIILSGIKEKSNNFNGSAIK